jgi:hypothetical protein
LSFEEEDNGSKEKRRLRDNGEQTASCFVVEISLFRLRAETHRCTTVKCLPVALLNRGGRLLREEEEEEEENVSFAQWAKGKMRNQVEVEEEEFATLLLRCMTSMFPAKIERGKV